MGSTTVSADLADLFSLGVAYVAPININATAGTTEVALLHIPTGRIHVVEGSGGGAGGGLGWSVSPVTPTYAGGRLFNLTQGTDLPSGGIGRVVKGPGAPASLAARDFEGYMTMSTLDLNFVATGGNLGLIVFADRPVIQLRDWFHYKAASIVAGISFVGGSLGVANSSFVCRSRLRG
ncbi:MAG: hypothetical protein MUE73_13475 [Planctomycetes bacterium]|nr:hypothetical protein [Planctomycetota bacterium]